MTEKQQELIQRITDYLASGGLFNPEVMNHDQIRALLLDVRYFLEHQSGQ